MQGIEQTSKGEECQQKKVTLRKETIIHEMILNKKEELAIGNCQFVLFKNGKKG
jgi:hypothetical protein